MNKVLLITTTVLGIAVVTETTIIFCMSKDNAKTDGTLTVKHVGDESYLGLSMDIDGQELEKKKTTKLRVNLI